jgi:hypothetical protein
VSFLIVSPGGVKTALMDNVPGILGMSIRAVLTVVGPFMYVPIDECGRRNVFMSTAGAFPALEGTGKSGVDLVEGVSIAIGVDGKPGSGVYSLGYDGSEAGETVINLLQKYRAEGLVGKIWKHTQEEFERITSHKR